MTGWNSISWKPYLLSAGKEAEGRPILTGWLREIRKLVADTAARRGHPIRMGVRVPSRPETAFGMGLDAITWAKEGLIDLLVVTPPWATLEFDMPLPEWRRLLVGSNVVLAGGLEIICCLVVRGPFRRRPRWPRGPPCPCSPAVRGCRLPVQRYQDTTWPLPMYQQTLKAMTSLDSLIVRPERYRSRFSRRHGAGRRLPAARAGHGQGFGVSDEARPAAQRPPAVPIVDRARAVLRQSRGVGEWQAVRRLQR